MTVAAANDKAIIGWIEPVTILPGAILLRAKIDTGADHSSLNAIQLKEFRRDGENWVHFQVVDENGNSHQLEKPVLRYTKIKRRGIEAQQRPVISLNICLHGRLREVDVNLANRETYNYKILIGRSYLQGLFIVDSETTNTTSPDCNHNLDKH